MAFVQAVSELGRCTDGLCIEQVNVSVEGKMQVK